MKSIPLVERSIVNPSSFVDTSVQARLIRSLEAVVAVRLSGVGLAVTTLHGMLTSESPTALVAKIRYAWRGAPSKPVSVKVVTPAPTVPATVQTPLSFAERSIRYPVAPATSIHDSATVMFQNAVAEVRAGWPGSNPTLTFWANSDVLPSESVAVALRKPLESGTRAVKAALPLPSVVTFQNPRYVRPGP